MRSASYFHVWLSYFLLGYVPKSSSEHSQRSTQRKWQVGEAQIIPCPSSNQGHPRSHHPTKRPCPQAQKSKEPESRWEPKLRTQRNGMICLGPSEGCPRIASALVSIRNSHHDESMLKRLSNRAGELQLGMGPIMECSVRIFRDCTMYYEMGRGGTEGREREGPGFGAEQAWEKRRIRGRKGSVTRQQRSLVHLAVPRADQHGLACLLIKLHF